MIRIAFLIPFFTVSSLFVLLYHYVCEFPEWSTPNYCRMPVITAGTLYYISYNQSYPYFATINVEAGTYTIDTLTSATGLGNGSYSRWVSYGGYSNAYRMDGDYVYLFSPTTKTTAQHYYASGLNCAAMAGIDTTHGYIYYMDTSSPRYFKRYSINGNSISNMFQYDAGMASCAYSHVDRRFAFRTSTGYFATASMDTFGAYQIATKNMAPYTSSYGQISLDKNMFYYLSGTDKLFKMELTTGVITEVINSMPYAMYERAGRQDLDGTRRFYMMANDSTNGKRKIYYFDIDTEQMVYTGANFGDEIYSSINFSSTTAENSGRLVLGLYYGNEAVHKICEVVGSSIAVRNGTLPLPTSGVYFVGAINNYAYFYQDSTAATLYKINLDSGLITSTSTIHEGKEYYPRKMVGMLDGTTMLMIMETHDAGETYKTRYVTYNITNDTFNYEVVTNDTGYILSGNPAHVLDENKNDVFYAYQHNKTVKINMFGSQIITISPATSNDLTTNAQVIRNDSNVVPTISTISPAQAITANDTDIVISDYTGVDVGNVLNIKEGETEEAMTVQSVNTTNSYTVLLDGVDDYVELSSNVGDLTSDGNFKIIAKINKPLTGTDYILSKSDTTHSSSTSVKGWNLGVSLGGNLELTGRPANDGTIGILSIAGAVTADTDKWVKVEFDGTTVSMSQSDDGVTYTGTVTSTDLNLIAGLGIADDVPTFVGRYWYGSSGWQYYEGHIKEIVIEKNGVEVHRYLFDNPGTNNPVIDHTGSEDGTSYNGAVQTDTILSTDSITVTAPVGNSYTTSAKIYKEGIKHILRFDIDTGTPQDEIHFLVNADAGLFIDGLVSIVNDGDAEDFFALTSDGTVELDDGTVNHIFYGKGASAGTIFTIKLEILNLTGADKNVNKELGGAY